MKNNIPVLSLFLLFTQCQPAPVQKESTVIYKPAIPSSIMAEHAQLLGLAQSLILNADSSEPEAKKLFELMQHHFKEEEDYALPPLGVLQDMMSDSMPLNSDAIIEMTTELKEQIVHLNVEHQLIVAYLEELKQKAGSKNLPDILEFEKALHHHAKIEEEVLFPAALLIGDYLQIKSEFKK